MSESRPLSLSSPLLGWREDLISLPPSLLHALLPRSLLFCPPPSLAFSIAPLHAHVCMHKRGGGGGDFFTLPIVFISHRPLYLLFSPLSLRVFLFYFSLTWWKISIARERLLPSSSASRCMLPFSSPLFSSLILVRTCILSTLSFLSPSTHLFLFLYRAMEISITHFPAIFSPLH